MRLCPSGSRLIAQCQTLLQKFTHKSKPLIHEMAGDVSGAPIHRRQSSLLRMNWRGLVLRAHTLSTEVRPLEATLGSPEIPGKISCGNLETRGIGRMPKNVLKHAGLTLCPPHWPPSRRASTTSMGLRILSSPVLVCIPLLHLWKS